MTKRPLDRTKVRQSVLLALFLVLVALQVLLSYEVEEGFSMRGTCWESHRPTSG